MQASPPMLAAVSTGLGLWHSQLNGSLTESPSGADIGDYNRGVFPGENPCGSVGGFGRRVTF